MSLAALFGLMHVACSSRAARVTPHVAREASRRGLAAEARGEAPPDLPTWASETSSPRTDDGGVRRDPREESLEARCGASDAGLQRVARAVATTRARGLGIPSPELLTAWLRIAGVPHEAPRLFLARGKAPLDEAPLRAKLQESLATSRAQHARLGTEGAMPRCGVALAPLPHGGELAVIVKVEALADLRALPSRVHAWTWLSFVAKVHVDMASAKLIVLGPRGLPRTVPTSFDPTTGVVRARFSTGSPGPFTVQLLGELSSGPRPLLEARVFADVEPPSSVDEPTAPGEEVVRADLAPTEALFRMINGARQSAGIAPVARDAGIDDIARAHAERMLAEQVVAHEAGDGDPPTRVQASGQAAQAVGENVAHAASVVQAHRVLYASASHRMNLLHAEYTHVGIGIAKAPDGSVYVCELFLAR